MTDEEKIVDSWQRQVLAESELNVEAVMKQAAGFQRQVRFRNMFESVGAAGVLIWSVLLATKSETPALVRAGLVLVALGGVAAAIALRLRGHAATSGPPLTAPTKEVIGWHRSELARQRDVLLGVPLWYLGPFVPGLVLVLSGAWLASPGHGAFVALATLLVAIVFGSIALVNRIGARKLQQRIDALERELDD